jgi:glycosyltransferase involved in cell wall biosynthesis
MSEITENEEGKSGSSRPLRVAMLGDRGIPARYGGYSTLIEEVAVRLAADPRFSITVYGRRSYYDEHPKEFRGVRMHYLHDWRHKYLESLLHTGMSVIHALTQRFDVIFVVDPGNSPLILPFWLLRKPTAIQTDGLGWKRRKWNWIARKYYHWSEKVAAVLANELVSDAKAIQQYYHDSYQAGSVFIPHGSTVGDPPNDACLEQFGLKSGEYFLIVTRVEPDNNTDILVREYKAANLERPLIIVGGARYPTAYSRNLEAQASDKIRFLGGVYDSGILNGLYAHSFAYLHGHVVGGTNPALLRAMDGGTCCVAMDVVFSRETLEDSGLFFSAEEGALAKTLQALEADPEDAANRGRQLKQRAIKYYRWDAVADAYANLFLELGAGKPRTEAYTPEKFWQE